MENYLAIESEIMLVAGIVAIGLIVVGKVIMTGFAMSRRPSHHLAEQTGIPPVRPESDILPPSGG